MKILTSIEIQSLILKSTEWAIAQRNYRSEDVIQKIKEHLAEGYLYYERRSVIFSDEKLELELQDDRKVYEEMYTGAMDNPNAVWDNEHGSGDNDCLYFLAKIRFNDLLLEYCFPAKSTKSAIQQKKTTPKNQPDLTRETLTKDKKVSRPFTKLLAGSYSKADLDRLLLYLRMVDETGERIWPQKKKSGLHGVIDALQYKNHLKEATREELMSALSIYLNLTDSRVKNGYSDIHDKIKKKALTFLNQPVKSKK